MSLPTNVRPEEQTLQARSSQPRLFQLDALRGLAAVVVMCSHFLLAFPKTSARWNLQLLSAGRSSVVLFFVLSGYVLSMPYWQGKAQPYGRYLVRRVCRIYLPFAAAAVLAIAGAFAFQHAGLALTPWFAATWHTPITAALILKQFFMVPTPAFNTAFWSLTFEMEMSIVMPLLCLLLRRANPLLATAAFGLLLAVHPMGRGLQVVFAFCLGAVLARYSQSIRAKYASHHHGQWAAFFLGIVLLLDLPFLLCTAHAQAAIGARDYLLNGAGAALVIVSTLHLPALATALRHGVAEYLGRISYSAYLTHGTVLFALVDLLYGRLPTPALLLLVAVASFLVGHLFCILVEEPSMRLGKRLTLQTR